MSRRVNPKALTGNRRAGSARACAEPLETRALLAAVKVMALGDSITEAFQGHASYRFWLDKRLELAGYDVDFVGSRTGVRYSATPPSNQGPPLYTDFDQHHEGHSGWRTDEVLDRIDEWAPQFAPDVVLLHLGTNDMLQSFGVSGAITRLGQIIDTIRVSQPNVQVALAKLIPSRILNNNIQALNAQIPALAAAKNTAQSPVVLVDQFAGFDAFADNYDDHHPNASGEIKMSDKWFAALTSLLPAPNPAPPRVTYLSELDWVSMTNGFGPVERNRSNGEQGAADGGAIQLNGVTTIRGLGTHASSEIVYDLGGDYARFLSDVGVDDEVGANGSVAFRVFVDGGMRYDSGTMTGATATKSFDLDVAGADTLRLVVTNAGDGDAFDHGDWANARLRAAPTVADSSFAYVTAPHAVSFAFRGNVSATLGPDDLLLENLTTGGVVPAGSIALDYNTATNAGTFTFPGFAGGVLPDGNYRATILAAGVSDAAGNPMIANHVFPFHFLRGDANHDGTVNLEDFNILTTNFGQTPRDFSQGDFNYDGTVNLTDFNLLAARFGESLAAREPSSSSSSLPSSRKVVTRAWERVVDLTDVPVS